MSKQEKKATLTEALGKAAPRHTFTNERGTALTVTLYPVSLLEIAEFEEFQASEGKDVKNVLGMLRGMLHERQPEGGEEAVTAFLRGVAPQSLGPILTTLLTGQEPDPNA